MDIQLKKKPWYIRYKYYLLGGAVFVGFAVYALLLALGPKRLRIDLSTLQVAEVGEAKFLEYVETEGVVQPILTIKVNTRIAGTVDRIVGEEGSMMRQGDTILLLTNPDMVRDLEDQNDALQKQLISYREQEIEMEQKTLTLRQKILQNEYELNRLKENFNLDKEEFGMGIKSKAQLKVAQDEYEYKLEAARLERENLKHDSVVTQIRRDLIQTDREREIKKFHRATDRLKELVVKAPVSGQLSFIRVTPGQGVGAGEQIGEIKVLDQFKVHTSLSEYYIDRIVSGLPASVVNKGTRYGLRVTKVVPEVKADRTFDVDLVFTDTVPDNVRVGKNYRVQIELGQPEQTVVIPRGDFYSVTGSMWIYKLVSGSRAVKVPIEIGRQNPQQFEIVSGLQLGDKVIVSGYNRFGDVEELILND